MSADLDMDTVWLTSGRLTRLPGRGYRCEVCGAEGGPGPSDIAHSPECTLDRAVKEIALATKMHRAPTPAQEADVDRMIAGVSHQDSETISVLLSELRNSKSRRQRLEAVHILQEMCPGAASGDLIQYAVTGISDEAQMEAIKRRLMFERAVAAGESSMMREMKQLMGARPPHPAG